MLFRFCLYGFLKNQQYYDPFLILAFREKGLSFAMIGLLIGFREICINILEIPTGAVADVLGRRRAMITSFLAYIVAFVIFGGSLHLWALFAAMFFFSIGEAFRTGTHKAMIFDWLARQGRADEKTKVYGRTRSWSKLGSAVSVVVAAIIVFATDQGFSSIFYLCIIPYAINIVNFLTYPKYLDGPRRESANLAGVFRALLGTFISLRSRPLRRLLIESMGFEGVFKVTKDYVQPVLKAAALALPVVLGLTGRQRMAVLVGAVYFVLYLASSFASRRADWLARRAGSEARGASLLWVAMLAAFVVLGGGVLAGLEAAVIAAFVALFILQNFWRPILIGRIADQTDPDLAATVLSVESQAKTLFAAIFAPLLGWSVDLVGGQDAALQFLPVALLGLVVATGMILTGRRRQST